MRERVNNNQKTEIGDAKDWMVTNWRKEEPSGDDESVDGDEQERCKYPVIVTHNFYWNES